jgi:hypothetical protein
LFLLYQGLVSGNSMRLQGGQVADCLDKVCFSLTVLSIEQHLAGGKIKI